MILKVPTKTKDLKITAKTTAGMATNKVARDDPKTIMPAETLSANTATRPISHTLLYTHI